MVDQIEESITKASSSMKDFKLRWRPLIEKQLARMESLENELLKNDNSGQLSVTAQYLLDAEMNKLNKLFEEMSSNHKQIHGSISRCGRELDKNFQVELNDLIKNQKDFESNPEAFQKVNSLIYEHLLSLGRIDVATTFARESEQLLETPKNCDIKLFENIMRPFREKNYLPAIEWIKRNASHQKDLLFKLHRQVIITLLQSGNKSDALAYCKNMQEFGSDYANEISGLMFVVVHYPNVGRHQNLFFDGIWLELEEQISHVLCQHSGTILSKLIDVGASAVPMLLELQRFITRRTSNGWLTDELPTEIPISEHVHSTFTCPILKVQTTDENPPIRLKCGHVISLEAMTKLIHTSRSQKLKCPYCPEECTESETKRLYF
ncbi:unnamed protein product [Bursaphelenchus xylophilus]|uniref:(pine wood nematode) hypothetical protein n=1 Tax=Bursaphelenchus xylophilus TaxID=6326 RepID=A0A1I7SDT3_BURXY|nr:unnamed protein product [Bursaphelenchus xylophilus]CAG9084308.1 unnamed protein product [Bursaphelenchus xylophilus]